MSYCCASKRDTAYCPDCGRRLTPTPLEDLLVYCNARVTQARVSLSGHKGVLTRDPENADQHRRARATAEADLATWQARADAVAEVIDKA